MRLILQPNKADDFVIASVREFISKAFTHVGIELEFKGSGLEEVGIVSGLSKTDAHVKVGDVVVKIDPRYFRPAEVEFLPGNPAKAKTELKWKLEYDLDALVDDMMSSDLQLFKRDHYLKEGGYKIFQYHE